MRFHIFQLDKENFKIDTFDNEQLVRKFLIPKSNGLKIYAVEITDVKNPSTLTIELHQQDEVKKILQLNRIRTQFLLQNDVFILDTSNLEFFNISFSHSAFFELSAKNSTDENFKVTLYAELDRPSQPYEEQYV